jgi:hypothetical protein
MEILSPAASSGSVSNRRNLDQAAVIVTALEQIFSSSSPASERRAAAVAYVRDELAAVECPTSWETGENFPLQFNLPDPPSPDRITGIAVRPSNVCRRCGDPVAIIGPGTPPHCASLHCRSCELHRGWLSRAHCAYLVEIVCRRRRAAQAHHPFTRQ